MNILKYGAIVLLSIGVLAILIYSIKSRRPFKTILLNAFMGIACLALIDLTSKFTGVNIPVNQWTTVGSAVYGIPAVIGFLILNFIF